MAVWAAAWPVVQAQALLASTEAKVPTMESSIHQAIHRLGAPTSPP